MPVLVNTSIYKEVDVSFCCSKLFIKGTYTFQLTTQGVSVLLVL